MNIILWFLFSQIPLFKLQQWIGLLLTVVFVIHELIICLLAITVIWNIPILLSHNFFNIHELLFGNLTQSKVSHYRLQSLISESSSYIQISVLFDAAVDLYVILIFFCSSIFTYDYKNRSDHFIYWMSDTELLSKMPPYIHLCHDCVHHNICVSILFTWNPLQLNIVSTIWLHTRHKLMSSWDMA